MQLRLNVLGGFEARLGPRSVSLATRKCQALLAFLSLTAPRVQSREALATLLWGETADVQARRSLRQALSSIRKGLGKGADLVVTDRAGVTLDPARIEVDALRFSALVAQRTPAALTDGVELYRGDLLHGLAVSTPSFDEWLTTARERLRGLAIDGLGCLLEHQMQSGLVDETTQTALRLLALDPAREVAHRALMRLYLKQGQRAQALRQYQLCQRTVRQELGTEPEAETQALFQEILSHGVAGPSPPGGHDPGRRLRARAAVRPAENAPEAPLVGRGTERAFVLATLDAAWSDGTRVLFLRGEAGNGKTRLAEELLGEAMRRGGRGLVGRCYETQQVLPLRPWVEAVEGSGLVREEPVVAALGREERARLERLFPYLAARERELPTASADAGRLLEAMAVLIARAAVRQPLVIVIEDMHWADDMTVRLFSFLGRSRSTAPVLLVGTARDEEMATGNFLARALGELRREKKLSELVLGALSQPEAETLVRRLASPARGEDLARLAQQVWRLSEGNPFVIVETMRSLSTRHEPDVLARLTVPTTVRDSILSRVDELSAPARRLLDVAAMIETEFSFELLRDAAALDERDATGGLEELVRRRFLHAAEDQLDFTHSRIREVLRDHLLPDRRRLIHRDIAAALERAWEGRLHRVHDRLAHHWLLGGHTEKTIEAVTACADTARQRYALDESVVFFDQALDLVDRLPPRDQERRRLDLVVRKAFALSLLARFAEIRDLLEPCQERVHALDNPSLASQFYFRLGLTHGYLGDPVRCEELGRRALAEARRADDPRSIGLAHHLLGTRAYWVGAPHRGIEHGQEAERLLSRAGLPEWHGIALGMLGAHHFMAGDLAVCLEILARAETIAEEVLDARTQSFSASWTAWALAIMGEGERALAAAHRGVDLARDPLVKGLALGSRAAALLELGQFTEARSSLEDILAAHPWYGTVQGQMRYRPLLAEACLATGDRDRAREVAAEATAMNTTAGHRWGLASSHRISGRIAHADGDLARAAGRLTEALDTFTTVGAVFEAARTRLFLAEVQHSCGAQEVAASHLAEALRVFRSSGLVRWQARVSEIARQVDISSVESLLIDP